MHAHRDNFKGYTAENIMYRKLWGRELSSDEVATGVRYERAMRDKGLEWSRRLV